MVKREWWRGCFGGFVLVLGAACGGESRRTDPGPGAPNSVPTPAPSNSVPSAIPSSMPAPTPTASSAPSTTPTAPLPTTTGTESSPSPPVSCPTNEVAFELSLEVGSITTEADGTTIETLQVPDYPAPDYTQPAPQPNSDPATWDRSELPAGACVFRVHGVHAACFPTGGVIRSNDPTADQRPLVASSYYDLEGCSVEPGCPSADTQVSLGWWWYLADRGDATDIVICAPDCAYYLMPDSAIVWLYPWGVCRP
jgi:hypothetical protein